MNIGRVFVILFPVLIGIGFLAPSFASDWDEDSPKKSANSSGKGATNATQANPSNRENQEPDRKKFYLKGQVEHSDHLPALEPSMQAGASFNAGAMPAAKYASNWFKIPLWFAGTFETTQSTIDFQKDYATGETAKPNHTVATVGRELHGYQQDAKGQIWHYYVQSGTSKAEQARQITFNNIDWYGPELVEDDKVVMRVLATSLIVDKQSGVIVDSFRREDIKTYTPLSLGQIRVNYTSKSFDSHGNPRDLQNGHSIYHQVARFQGIDSGDGQNYKQLFLDFLKK